MVKIVSSVLVKTATSPQVRHASHFAVADLHETSCEVENSYISSLR